MLINLIWHFEEPSENTNTMVDMIDKQTKEIRQDEDETVYKSIDELAADLPDHSPRFILLSYPMTLVGDTLPLGL